MPLYLGNKLVSGQTRPIDGAVTQDSKNLITSGAVKTYVDDIVDDLATEAQLNEAISGIQVPVQSVNGKTGAVSLSASDVGADASGTAISAVSIHNSSATAHSDIRTAVANAANAAATAQSTADSKATMVQVNAAISAAFANIALAEEASF